MGSIPTDLPPFGPGVRVAVIGAGVSGICTAAHLLRHGAAVTVFERSAVSSGVWHFDPRVDAASTSFPSKPASAGDYTRSVPGQFGAQRGRVEGQHPLSTTDEDALHVAFSPPGPCYAGLKNNVPTTLLYSSLRTWPEGTEESVSHWTIEQYLQDLSAETGVDAVTLFHTRVEDAHKSSDNKTWSLRTITLQEQTDKPRIVEKTWEFDAVVVASGHYNLPRVPDIPGLAEYKAQFPDRVSHTKEYRNAESLRGKNVVVIGGGTSALDVCRELSEVATSVIQSTRGGLFDHPASMLPESVKRVGEVVGFISDHHAALTPSTPIPGHLVLKDGTTLQDVHHVILATGYITSYPFLPQYHADTLPLDQATSSTLITLDGAMVHNLHKDIFYIPDPSLAFVGVPYYIATFSLFDFQAQAVARVFTGKTRLPSTEDMRVEYKSRVLAKGLGRNFHSLALENGELVYVKDLVEWVNKDGEERMEGHTEAWLDTYRRWKEMVQRFRKEDAPAITGLA